MIPRWARVENHNITPSLWLHAGLLSVMLDPTLISPSTSSLGEEDPCCVVTACPACGFVLFVICHQKQLVGKIILGTTPNPNLLPLDLLESLNQRVPISFYLQLPHRILSRGKVS